MQNLSNFFSKANTLASQIYKATNKSISWGSALSWAFWAIRNNCTRLVEMIKKDGSRSKRVIVDNITDFITIKGTGSTNGYQKAIDLCKFVCNMINGKKKSVVISFINPPIELVG